jgi:hypothetical protein
MSERASATRRIKAPAERIFAVVSSPQGHVDIDGSGMLTSAPDNTPLRKVGDHFDMEMDRRPLGDIPNLAEYSVRNFVVTYEPDRVFEWEVGSRDREGTFGHVYGWQIDPVNEGECDVTNYVDWSNLPEASRKLTEGRWPIVPVSMLEESVEKLAKLVEN